MAPSEPVYCRGMTPRPMLSTTTDPALRKILKENSSQSGIAIETVQTQLKLWEEESRQKDAVAIDCRILGLDLSKLEFRGYFGQYVVEDVEVVSKAVETLGEDEVLKRGIWSWSKLPYAVKRVGSSNLPSDDEGSESRRRKKAKVVENDELVDDIDEWVLRNEVFLRSLSKTQSNTVSSLKPWFVGLIRIEDLANSLLNCSAVTSPNNSNLAHALKISRSPVDVIPGYTVLTHNRSAKTFVQPSSTEFKRRFDSMTGGLLAGLNWDNIFVAGGLVLGALLTPDIPSTAILPAEERSELNQPLEWISSDIDLYIYGLNVLEANAKIQHIAKVYQSNLGSARAPFLVVRNSQTITLYSEWPKRRVQIVLKLVKSPREVLLNFDLDVCAVGWDGKEVWMLPRFVRALETGTNVFTMDLINGHYLGDRKATRDKRVFKYAKRGYGIRIIPLYLGFLSSFQTKLNSNAEALAKTLADLSLGEKLTAPPLYLSNIAVTSRAWTRRVVERYIKNGQNDVTHFWPHGRWPRVEPKKEGVPMFSHAMLEGYGQITSEPLGRSCLTGFALFMRHVALWELEKEGKIEIFEHIFADDVYNNLGQVAYDDTPAYEWNESFSIRGFIDAIDAYNHRERNNAIEEWTYNASGGNPSGGIEEKSNFVAKRVTYSTTSIDDVLSSTNDLAIPIIIETEFVEFANELVMKALQENGLPNKIPLEIVSTGDNEDEMVLAVWRLDKVLNWEMADRRIDEIREVIWALHRANERMVVDEDDRLRTLKTNISRRAIRTSEKDEINAFVRWVGRQPYEMSTNVNGIFIVGVNSGREPRSDEDDGYNF